MWRKTRQCIWGWSWLIFSKTFSILRNTLPQLSKKLVHLLFCVFRTKLNKAVSIFCRLPEWIRNVLMIARFSTRLGWECGWKCCMANSKDWRSENLNAIELSCEVVKKVATPPFLHQPPHPTPPLLLFRFIPPPKWLNFWKDLSPFNKGVGGEEGGGSNYEMPMLFLTMIKIIDLICLINFTPYNFIVNSFQSIF